MPTNPNPSRRANITPGLSVPTSVTDRELRRFLQSLKEHIQGGRGTKGQPKERFVTLADLEKAGLATVQTVRGRGEIVKTAEDSAALLAASVAATISLAQLSDVILSDSLVSGQVLTYNSGLGKWVAADPEDAGEGNYPAELGYAGI